MSEFRTSIKTNYAFDRVYERNLYHAIQPEREKRLWMVLCERMVRNLPVD